MEGKVDHREELEFEGIEFGSWNSSDSGIIGVVVVRIVEKLGGDHDGGDEEAMDVERGEEEA